MIFWDYYRIIMRIEITGPLLENFRLQNIYVT